MLILVIIFLFGVGAIYDSVVGDGKIPESIEIGRLNSVRYIAKFNTTQYLEEHTNQECWEALQPTLKILRETAPHVEKWLVSLYESKKLRFNHNEFEYTATFDLISRELEIYEPFFREQDGIKVAILCHEWRHSRQNYYKFFKYVFSYILTKELKEDLIENDAYLYEKQVLISIYGYSKDQVQDKKVIERIINESTDSAR